MEKIKVILSLFVIMILMSSCSEFSKILKEKDPDKKYDAAIAYYNEGECLKSSTILEDLLPLYRGTKKSEDIYYYYSKSHFCDKDYILAGYYFRQFVKTFPQSKYSEECSYLSAICSYKESPISSLDQDDTDKALKNFQLFLEKYPETEKKDTINSLMDVLSSKLEDKAYENAKLYQTTLNYKSAVIAYNNFLKDYPATKYREELMFNIINSNYSLAINSIKEKKESRLKDTIKSYNNFVTIFPESKYSDRAKRLLKLTQKELGLIKG